MKHQSKNVVKCKQGMNCLVTFFNEGLNCSVFLLNENLRTTKRTLARLFKRRINPLNQSERKQKQKQKQKRKRLLLSLDARLPSPSTASSRAFSVNGWDSRSDHETRNVSAVRNNEA